MIPFSINGQTLYAEEGTTILEAARAAGIRIPALCYLKDYTQGSACRMCLVQVKGIRNPVTACNTKVGHDMEIRTDTEEIHALRRQNLQLIASNHRMDCTYCSRFPYCELNALMREYGLDDRIFRYSRPEEYDRSAGHLVRDNSKCILCGRCMAACQKQGIEAIGLTGRGIMTRVTPGADRRKLSDTGCIGCGQCIQVCPVGALREKDDTRQVLNELHHHKKHVWAGITTEAAILLGECMREEAGGADPGRAAALLRLLGFEKVFRLDRFEALALAREEEEYKRRLKEGGCLPLISAGCPGTVQYVKKHHKELIPFLASGGDKIKSFANYCRNTAAKEAGIRKDDLYLTVISTCTAEKNTACEDVDACLTVRELAAMFRRSCVSDFTALEVWNGLKEAAFDRAKGLEIPAEQPQAASADSGAVLGLAQLEEGIRAGVSYIRCSACPGGCLNGGGAPRVTAQELEEKEYLEKRKRALGAARAESEANG